MPSPPGTSPTPVRPALSRRMTRLRVNQGAWAPHRLSSMPSWPATGMTCISVTIGLAVCRVSVMAGGFLVRFVGGSGGSGLEALHQRLRAVAQHVLVGAHGDEQAAELDVALRQGLVAGEDAGGLAAGLDAADGVLDRGQHLRVLGVAEVAERGGEVARADEDAVDAFHAGDRLDVPQ